MIVNNRSFLDLIINYEINYELHIPIFELMRIHLFITQCSIIGMLGCSTKQVDSGSIKKHVQTRIDSIFASVHFNTKQIYSTPICFIYDGTPLLRIGGAVSALPNSFDYNSDPNGDYSGYSSDVTDYVSTNEIAQPTGSLNGIFYFSADNQKHRIFNFSGNYLFYTDTTRVATESGINALRKTVFPCLPPNEILLKNKDFQFESKDYTERFRMVTPSQSGSSFKKYDLRYEVVLKH